MAISLSELLQKQFPPENHLVGSGLLDYNSYLFVAGPPKSYKSFVMATLAIQLACGTPLFNATRKDKHGKDLPAFPVQKQCRVLILEQEVGEMDMQTRLGTMLGDLYPADLKAAGSNIYVHSCDHKMRLDNDEGRDYIQKIVEAVRPDVLILDPLKEFHCSDENSSQDMGLVFSRLDSLKEHYKFACIITHHARKSFQGGDDDDPESMRGSSQLFGKGDTYMMVRPQGRRNGNVRVSFTLRRGKPLPSMGLQLDRATLKMAFDGWNVGKRRKEDDNEDGDNWGGTISVQ